MKNNITIRSVAATRRLRRMSMVSAAKAISGNAQSTGGQIVTHSPHHVLSLTP